MVFAGKISVEILSALRAHGVHAVGVSGMRTTDGGKRWESPDENLPAHLEAGFLMRDPTSPSTIYAGFALTAPDALRRQAAEGRSALMRLSMSNLAGGVAFLALLMLGAIVVLRRLARSSYRAAQGEPTSG